MTDFDYGKKDERGQYERHPGLDVDIPVSWERRKYIHLKCGAVTSMPVNVARQMMLDPSYYGRTFCTHCQNYLPLAGFVWEIDRKPLTEKVLQ